MRELFRGTAAYKSMKDRGAHTVLVIFPDEVYLRSLLKECAKAFFGAADGSRAERLIEEEHYMDCVILPEAGGKLTAEMGNNLIDESVLRPVEGDKKLFVIDNFHLVTPLVQNKLLKVLEEPPEGVWFLLGAANEHAVLPTVLSRAKQIRVSPFSAEEVASALRRKNPKAKGVDEAAVACGGIYSVAERLVEGGEEIFLSAEKYLSGENTEAFCRSLGERKDAKLFFAAVRMVLRDVMFVSQGCGEYAARKSGGIQKLADAYPGGAARASLALVERAEREISFNANFQQCALALAIGLKKEREKWQTLS